MAAEAVLFNIAEKIVRVLSSRLLQELGLWWGVSDELSSLKDQVSLIQRGLLDAEKQYSTSDEVKNWLGMLKEAVYDAEDLLDQFSTEALRQQILSGSKLGKEVRLFFSSSNQFAYGLRMAYKIKAIKKRLDEIIEYKKFQLDERLVESVVRINREREETHSSLPNVVVGREDDKKEIMKVLVRPDFENSVSVISIVGMGGLGKTTLAQLVFDDEVVKTKFELKLWVCVGESFGIKSIIRKILECIEDKEPGNLEMNSLKNQLHRSMNGKKYMLVLDDVWNEEPKKWLDLMDLLVGGAEGSKIIITTRHMMVAKIARSVLVHPLKGLSDNESWNLFKKVAFIGGEVPSPSLEEIGKEIVQRCKGVPLAIKSIGCLMYSKESEVEWQSFKDGELSTLNQPGDNDILPTLRLSYNNLPSHLKHCFAYCRLFPKDYKIDVQTLVELWIAQGFVHSSNVTQSLKHIGLQYFKELLWRSFFQEVEEDDFGNIHTCKMHDLMHDLAKSVAGGEVTSSSSTELFDEVKTRHISIDCGLSFTRQDILSLLRARQARTFILVNKFVKFRYNPILEEKFELILSELKCLRALDLRAVGIKRVPNSIKKLELLTYLDLSYNKMTKLPNSITRLSNLQVLKVDECDRLEELPKDIRKLVKLSCLGTFGCYGLTHMPRGIGQLTGLETLSLFVVDKQGRGADFSELNQLRNLKGRLGLSNLRYVKNPKFEFQALKLKERKDLQVLELDWDSSIEDEDGNEVSTDNIENDEMAMDVLQPHHNLKELWLSSYKGAKFSSWLSSLTTLVELRLKHCENIHCLPSFDQFPSLKILWLQGLANLEYIESGIRCNNGSLPLFFPSLKTLYISNCPVLKGWMTHSGIESLSKSEFPNLQCLSHLSIYDCPNLSSVPPTPAIEVLAFGGKSMKQLEHLLNSYSPLSQLREMTIKGIEEGAVLAAELHQKLVCLTWLFIESCPGIEQMQCPPFDLRGLCTLWFSKTLETEFLPNWLPHLSTLNSLYIQDGPNLASLPECMSNLTSLQHLHIFQCPNLSESCNINGEDWPKIAHIPNITIDGLRVHVEEPCLQEFKK